MTTIKADGLFYVIVCGMVFINEDRKEAYSMAIEFLRNEIGLCGC